MYNIEIIDCGLPMHKRFILLEIFEGNYLPHSVIITDNLFKAHPMKDLVVEDNVLKLKIWVEHDFICAN